MSVIALEAFLDRSGRWVVAGFVREAFLEALECVHLGC